MTPQERDLIADLFRRLDTVADSEIDTEARVFIERQVSERPHALYVLAQTALVQEHALKGAQIRIAELEARLAEPKPADAAPRRSFLSGLIASEPAAATEARPFDPWSRQAKAASPGVAQAAPSPAGPWGAPPAAAPPQGPSFLKSAVATAAGVAGGALLFQGIGSLLGHGGGPFGQGGAAKPAEPAAAAHDYVPGAAAAEPVDAGYQDAAFDQAAFPDPGSDDESV